MLNRLALQRKLSTAMLVVVLLVPVASFAASRKPAATPAPGNLFELFRAVLISLWNESGCKIDPSGHCVAVSNHSDTSSAGKADSGCKIDPDGRCLDASKTQADTGCGIDPNGACLGRN